MSLVMIAALDAIDAPNFCEQISVWLQSRCYAVHVFEHHLNYHDAVYDVAFRVVMEINYAHECVTTIYSTTQILVGMTATCSMHPHTHQRD